MMCRLILACLVLTATFSDPAMALDEQDDFARAKALLSRVTAYYKEKGAIALATFSRQSKFVTDSCLCMIALLSPRLDATFRPVQSWMGVEA